MNKLERYQVLQDGYLGGLYTGQEVVGQVLGMLAQGNDREALWTRLLPVHRDEVAHFLRSFDESAPPMFPLAHWQRVKDELVEAKRWFLHR